MRFQERDSQIIFAIHKYDGVGQNELVIVVLGALRSGVGPS